MNLLVVSSRPPWPPVMADAMTVERTIRYLAGRGHRVDLACFTGGPVAEAELRGGLGGVCGDVATVHLPTWRSYLCTAAGLPGRRPMQVDYYRSRAMAELVCRMVEERAYDVVYTHLVRMAEYTRRLHRPKVINLVVSQALNYGRLLEHVRDPVRRLFYTLERAKVRSYEVELCADYDRVIVCGDADRAELERGGPLPNAFVNPHGQDVPPPERLRGARREAGAIVLSGVMSTFTNVDAACWFAERVFPRIERAVPQASLRIVGRNPQRAVRALARPPRVVVTGEVPDVSDWLLRAEVAVAPLRIAAGMQNKIVQAMACGLPVVATSVANEGIGARPDEHLLLRDDPDAFGDAVVGLLRDAAARERLGAAARRHVESRWTWEALFERLEKVLMEVAG
jgi:glycosyltransferase involved in cell wall biosynthesis